MIYEYEIKHDDFTKTVLDTAKCANCGYCTFVCEEGVYKQEKDIVVVANPENCTSCNECACPFGARTFIPHNEKIEASSYALIGHQEYIR